MYALIIVIGMLSQGAGSAVMPVGVTSQIVGKFKNLDECKTAASQPTREALFQISVCQPPGESIGIAHTLAGTNSSMVRVKHERLLARERLPRSTAQGDPIGNVCTGAKRSRAGGTIGYDFGNVRRPLLAQSGHGPVHCKCPLSGVNQT